MSDEQQIRDLVATWLRASRQGDVDTVLGLVTDDVVFLVPGRPPMRKPEFAAISRAQAAPGAPAIDASSEIQEIQVSGDWAFAWTALRVSVTPEGAPPMVRAGYTLTLFHRVDGKWLLARDANVISPVGQ